MPQSQGLWSASVGLGWDAVYGRGHAPPLLDSVIAT